jgi:lantibiotic modifying enzyme
MWEWHSSLYLGAAHGVTGILHALLDFTVELLQVDERALTTIDQTLEQLNGFCFESGNLVSSLPKSGDFRDKKDRLVQFCHGSPGHVLLLVQMYVTSPTNHGAKHLNMAKQIAESTIFPRGLLRKGVGLCHGISGNAYCFLSVHNAELKESIEKTREHQHNDWLRHAYTYVNFALDNIDELKSIPDRPYSLYEGLAGLVCFLLDLVGQRDGTQSRFPCFEL